MIELFEKEVYAYRRNQGYRVCACDLCSFAQLALTHDPQPPKPDDTSKWTDAMEAERQAEEDKIVGAEDLTEDELVGTPRRAVMINLDGITERAR